MRRISLAIALGSLVAAAMLFSSHGSKSTGYSAALGAGVAYAQDDGDPIPLPPLPGRGNCSATCVTSGTTHYCGSGGVRRGCDRIVNNTCIFKLCPP